MSNDTDPIVQEQAGKISQACIVWGVVLPLALVVLIGILCSMLDDESSEIEIETADNTTIAYKLAVVADVGWRQFESTERRFAFVLPRLNDVCTDIVSEERVADHLVLLHQQLEEAGLEREEELPQLVDNVFSLANVIGVSGKGDQCVEIWVMYILARRKGMSQHDALEGVKQYVIEF